MSWFEGAIVAFITLSILYHVWKGGAANPESTGTVGRKFTGLAAEVAGLGGRLRHVETEVKELKGEAATTKDIARIEERINTVRAEAEGHRALSQQTNDSVRRIERIILEKGLSSK